MVRSIFGDHTDATPHQDASKPSPFSHTSIPPDEMTAAFNLAEQIARARFSPRSHLAQWFDEAHDTALDEVLRAARTYNPSRGPFAAMVRSYVNRRLSLLRRRKLESAGHKRRIQLTIEFEPGNPCSLSIHDLPEDLLASLTDLQRDTMARRYTFSATFQEIADTRSVSRQAAHRIHKRAINRLRRNLTADNSPADHHTAG
jgi:DNA-directed RNA polymerase specialized sigma24 family protein